MSEETIFNILCIIPFIFYGGAIYFMIKTILLLKDSDKE